MPILCIKSEVRNEAKYIRIGGTFLAPISGTFLIDIDSATRSRQ